MGVSGMVRSRGTGARRSGVRRDAFSGERWHCLRAGLHPVAVRLRRCGRTPRVAPLFCATHRRCSQAPGRCPRRQRFLAFH